MLKKLLSLSTLFSVSVAAADLKVGDSAPIFKLKKHDSSDFDLAARKGTWTVLFFYPKAGTPGCTKQACGFRDHIQKIRDQGAEVFGISSDTVESQAKFHKEQNLNFDLLADPNEEAIKAFGTKIFGISFSKRWTFIIDPELKIRAIDKDVDPVLDAVKVAKKIEDFKAGK